MTTVSRFSRQNDAGLRTLNVVLWENLVLVVVLVLQSKGPYWLGGASSWKSLRGIKWKPLSFARSRMTWLRLKVQCNSCEVLPTLPCSHCWSWSWLSYLFGRCSRSRHLLRRARTLWLTPTWEDLELRNHSLQGWILCQSKTEEKGLTSQPKFFFHPFAYWWCSVGSSLTSDKFRL